jgi:hypothetical protein
MWSAGTGYDIYGLTLAAATVIPLQVRAFCIYFVTWPYIAMNAKPFLLRAFSMVSSICVPDTGKISGLVFKSELLS